MRANPDYKINEAAKQARHKTKLGPAYLARARALYQVKRRWINSQKVKCSRCSETHVACLEFHHLDPNEKEFVIAKACQKSLKTIQAEIAKCIVICSNCHRKLHYKEKKQQEDAA